MSIDALSLVMFMVVGAPFSFKVKDIEIEILILGKQIVNEPHLDIFD